jgi:hypothetical protein
MLGFEVRVNSRNFLIEREGLLEMHGFFTNVYLEAENEEEAENRAMDILRNNETLRKSVRNEKTDPPIMHLDEITEISNYDEIEPKSQGLIWYRENKA